MLQAWKCNIPKEKLNKTAKVITWKCNIHEEKLNKTAKVNFYGTINEVESDIKDKLTKEQIEIFRGTCFRHFLDVQQTHLAGQIILNMNIQQIYYFGHQDNDEDLHFDVSSILVTMKKLHFSLTTGLRCFGTHILNYSIYRN